MSRKLCVRVCVRVCVCVSDRRDGGSEESGSEEAGGRDP